MTKIHRQGFEYKETLTNLADAAKVVVIAIAKLFSHYCPYIKPFKEILIIIKLGKKKIKCLLYI